MANVTINEGTASTAATLAGSCVLDFRGLTGECIIEELGGGYKGGGWRGSVGAIIFGPDV